MTIYSVAQLSSHKIKKYLAMIIFLLMLGLSSYQVVYFFKPNDTKTASSQPINSQTITPSIDSNSPLFSQSLFGDYTSSLSDSDIKQSTLDIEIVGILHSTDAKKSQILIQGADKEAQAYLINDKLPGGAIIKRISQSSIVVLYNNTLERLNFDNDGLMFDKPAKPLRFEKE